MYLLDFTQPLFLIFPCLRQQTRNFLYIMDLYHKAKEKFIQDLSCENITLSDRQLVQFSLYCSLLLEWNQKMNLTAITDVTEIFQKHFTDSLMLSRAADLSSVHSLIDIGTGAGFPGIPLKIVYPNLDVVLLDSLKKRVDFLEMVIRSLKLEHVCAFHARAEDAARNPQHREKYDLVVSRAVARLSVLSEYSLPFSKIGGKFISYKSADCQQEVQNADSAIRQLGGRLSAQKTYCLPNSDIGRSLICIEKVKTTPNKYPRKAGTPAKNPL